MLPGTPEGLGNGVELPWNRTFSALMQSGGVQEGGVLDGGDGSGLGGSGTGLVV